jgi:hypothetical protein
VTTHTRTPTTTPDGRIPTGKSKDGRAVRSGDETVQYWIDGLFEREPRRTRVAPTSIIARGDSIYSYGEHFEMARILRRKSGVPHMLTSAGIDFSSIRPLEIRESRYTHHEMSSEVQPGPFAQIYDAEHNPTGEFYTDKASVERTGMGHAYAEGYAELKSDGLWHWTAKRHWMGDSLIRAKSTEQRSRKPTPEEREQFEWYATVAKWVETLRDEHRKSYVHGEGYDERLMSWSMDLSSYMYELQSNLPHGLTRNGPNDIQVRFTVERWATYLSSFDYNEPHRPYFFCELPYGSTAKTVEEGIDALMPMQVRAHIGLGDDVLRQGDIFAIPTDFDTEELESKAAPVTVSRGRYVPNPVHIGGDTWVVTKTEVLIRRFKAQEEYPSGALDIHGTNHRATHVIVTKDGRWFGRGRLVHAPAHRDPDHRVVKLANDVWYEFVKNTVPTVTNGQRNRATRNVGASTFQSGQSRAWSVGGGVD